MRLRITLVLIALLLLVLAYLELAWHWSYSDGERAGWLQKFSHKGFICKTWEGEISMAVPGSTAVEKFHFTVHDDDTAARLEKLMGQRVSLHYEQKMGLPTSCFGETRYFIVRVTPTPEILLAPGLALPNPAASAASGARP